MRFRQPHILLGWCFLIAFCALAVGACTDEYLLVVPPTPSIPIIDSNFVNAPGDSIFASINDKQIVFATSIERPNYYNTYVEGKGYFISIKATRDGLDDSFEILSLRLDNVRDTGVYLINNSFTVPKEPDLSDTAAAQYSGSYTRKGQGEYPEWFRQNVRGEVHILKILEISQEQRVLIGTFWFIASNPEDGTEIRVDGGAFRIYVNVN